ncbi:11250_t:CDS:2 [Entrophospora sp. SA101]|nr:11250_t:CDS:2 [Entrophospora sp. SA101]
MRFILKSGTIVKDLIDRIPHNNFWNGNHLILGRSNAGNQQWQI